VPLRPTYPVRTPRLLLRPIGIDDVPALLSYRSLGEVARYVPFEPMGPEEVADFAARQSARTAVEQAGDHLYLGVELAAAGELVGDVMLGWISDVHRCAEIGWVLSPAHQGHGYATEAARAILALAFDGLHAHRVVARVDARNDASVRVARRLGMRQEARLVENEWFKGGWSDELDFALLEHEWQAPAGPGPSARGGTGG
jgi:RimJ/RimL family protein N-acetyltransferase